MGPPAAESEPFKETSRFDAHSRPDAAASTTARIAQFTSLTHRNPTCDAALSGVLGIRAAGR